MEEEEACNLGLSLGLGRVEFMARPKLHKEHKNPVQFNLLFPKEEITDEDHDVEETKSKTNDGDDDERKNNTTNDNYNNNNNNNGMRKKLKMTIDQTMLLENTFKEHNTPNSMQKQELANLLNLKPRQVEVWFQNRRARTKLKQTEVDYESLKKYCQGLSDENKRLKKELQELRSQFYVQAAMMMKCPSCNMISKSSKDKNTIVFDVGKSNSCAGFDNSSLTC